MLFFCVVVVASPPPHRGRQYFLYIRQAPVARNVHGRAPFLVHQRREHVVRLAQQLHTQWVVAEARVVHGGLPRTHRILVEGPEGPRGDRAHNTHEVASGGAPQKVVFFLFRRGLLAKDRITGRQAGRQAGPPGHGQVGGSTYW